MIPVTFNGAPAYLLHHEPDWRARVSLKAAVPTNLRRSLTGREARRPLAAAPRCSLSWTALLDRAGLTALRNALQDLGEQPILCPAWPFATAPESAGAVTGALVVGWMEGWTDYEFGATLTDLEEWDYVAPLLVGRLEQFPPPANVSPLYAEVPFDFVEDASALYALTPAAVAWANGPALGDATTPPVFPFPLTWNAPIASGGAETEIERQPLGKSRATAATWYPQSPERLLAADLLLTSGGDIATLLRWLLDQRGSAGAGYVTEAATFATLRAAAPAGQAELQPDVDADAWGENRLAELSHGEARALVRAATVDYQSATLTEALARAWPAGAALRLALLARLAKDELQLEFTTPDVATCRLAWRELPAEYTPATGETRGTTLGALPAKAWLYTVTLDWNGATETHRWTSYERDLTASGQAYYARPCEHGELRQSLALDRDEITLKLRWWAGCPFRQFLPNALDAKVTLAIHEADVAGDTASNLVQWFGGEITGLSADGPMLTLSAAGANALFDRKVPRLLLQTTCNHALFDAGCGLSRAAWEFTADVVSASGATLVLENFARTGDLPDGFGFAHWFALGYVEATIDGRPVRRIIFDSTALAAGRITLTLASAFETAPEVSASVKLWPGCDGRKQTCDEYNVMLYPEEVLNTEGKFANYARFGGFPYIPTTSPQFQPLKTSASIGGKK